MSLKEQLALARLPGRSKPKGKGGIRINQAQELAKNGIFQAFQDNKEMLERFQKSQKRENLKNEILNGVDSINIGDMNTLREVLIIALNKPLHQFQENGFNHLDLYGRYEAKMIYIFIANMLGINETEIKAFTYGDGSRLNEQFETQTILHILNNRPGLLPILSRMGIAESSLTDKLPRREEKAETIIVKKGNTIEDTLQNICDLLDINLGIVFKSVEQKGNKDIYTEEQKVTLRELGHILRSIYNEHGQAQHIAKVLSEKTGVKRNTIYSSYIRTNSNYPEVQQENNPN